jgi:Protein of unknown function (DUF1569)
MALPNIFTKPVADGVIQRINNLTASTQGQWGKMAVAQMLAHCCVSYEMLYEDKHPKPNAFVRFMLKMFVKNPVVNEVPYKKNSGTAPVFIIKGDRDFDAEKNRLIDFIKRTQELGEGHFDGKASHSFGNLTKTEWNNLFYKHLDHHLTQFGV